MEKYGSTATTAVEADLLSAPCLPKGDLVFSVGLIEHFDADSTAKVIKAHFDAVTPGGMVLMTYPTPRVGYVPIRRLAELFRVWRFHDERPLLMKEVGAVVSSYGSIVNTRLNWFIGLSQEIVLAKCKP